MATLLLFASAREAAGTGRAEVEGATVGDVLDAAVERFGPGLAHVLAHSKVWLNGDPASREQPVPPGAEVASKAASDLDQPYSRGWKKSARERSKLR